MVADFLAAELGDVAGDDEVRTPQLLALLRDGAFLLNLRQVVAVQHAESIGLLQVGDQDGLGLPAEAIHSVREQAAHIAGAVIELANRNRIARTLVGAMRGGHLGDFEAARMLGGAAG